jgi:hypothetical protein
VPRDLRGLARAAPLAHREPILRRAARLANAAAAKVFAALEADETVFGPVAIARRVGTAERSIPC